MGGYCVQIIEFQIMEWECDSKDSIDSAATHFTTLSLNSESEIVKNLLLLIANEVALEINHISPHLNERLRSAYEELIMQLRVELRRMEKARLQRQGESEVVTTLEGRIRELVGKVLKLKEIAIYFGLLTKHSSSLQRDVEKFLFYKPNSHSLEERLEAFFSSPLVSELFLKEYEKSFNTNNFSADLIDFFHFLHQNGLLQIPPRECYSPVRNKDLMLIQNSNIIFRQICDINDKYAHVEEQLQQGYVHLRFIREEHSEEDYMRNKFKAQEGVIQQKFVHLQTIFHKIKAIYGGIEFNNLDKTPETLLLPQEPALFQMLNQNFDYHFNSRNEEFLGFLESLYDPSLVEELEEAGKVHFDFLRRKIIRAETRWHLNRVISAFNVGSHLVSQLQTELTLTHHSYSFTSPWILSKYEFNSSRVGFYSAKTAVLNELFVLNRNTLISRREDSYILQVEKDAVIYPSAVNNYLYFLKFIYVLSSILQQKGIYSQELMLELIEIKADEMMEWAEIAINLYDIIKAKYFRCYPLLQKYLALIFQLQYQQELDWLQRNLQAKEGVSQVLQRFISKEKKAGCISQIVFQFQADYDIRECLLRLYEIEKQHRCAFYCMDSPYFYEKVLNEIIQTKNNLKFDRCLSFNALHQTFGFLAARPNDLRDLAQQLTPLSSNYLRLPDLLRFYAAQTKLKREVFKAELYWITIAQPSVKNKFIINSQRKKVNFRDFLEENAKNILCLTDKPLPYFLNSLQEFERSVFLFSQEVQRLKLIQCSLLYLRPDFPLEDHISAFSHKELVTFFDYCTRFNLIEDLYLRRDKRNCILNTIKRLAGSGKLRFTELSLDPTLLPLKHTLANYIFFIFSFEHHYTYDDCIRLIKRVVATAEPPEYALKLEILRSKRDLLKEYEECQFMDSPSLSELTQIYELLLLIAINKLLRKKQLEERDAALFAKIRKELPFYQCFKAVDILQNLQTVKEFSCTSSRAHTFCALKSIMCYYREMRERSKRYQGQWQALQNMGFMTEIGIVARRLFCNEVIELKRIVSADEWRTFNKTVCLSNLKDELDRQFTSRINDFISLNLQGITSLDIARSLPDNIAVLQQLFKKQIFLQYDEKYSLQVVRKEPIVLFDEFRGYEVEWREKEEQRQAVRNIKNNRTNFKRGMLNTLKREDQGSTQVINQLQHRINLEIVKESLPIRKLIYQLQLEGKRIRDEISWETCKLEHNVITKINKFIEESTLDQKQSLINFKYTVNLETIKGIENVIHERTAIFHKNTEEQLSQTDLANNGFITEPSPAAMQEKGEELSEEETLLDLNVRYIFNHVKKLRIFWAWKNIHLKRMSNEDEWIKFSENVEKILHNRDNLKRMENLQELRENCNRHEIICNLIKEENVLLNNSIKRMKVNNLTKKLNSFKDKYKVEEHP